MIEREIFQDGLLVVTKCSGKITADELIHSARWMIDNYGELIKPGFCQIFDALEANSDAITEDDIHRVAHINLNLGRNRRGFSMAILAAKPYPLTLARLHKLLSAASNIHVEIFNDIDAAFEWLHHNNPYCDIKLPDKEAVGY